MGCGPSRVKYWASESIVLVRGINDGSNSGSVFKSGLTPVTTLPAPDRGVSGIAAMRMSVEFDNELEFPGEATSLAENGNRARSSIFEKLAAG